MILNGTRVSDHTRVRGNNTNNQPISDAMHSGRLHPSPRAISRQREEMEDELRTNRQLLILPNHDRVGRLKQVEWTVGQQLTRSCAFISTMHQATLINPTKILRSSHPTLVLPVPPNPIESNPRHVELIYQLRSNGRQFRL